MELCDIVSQELSNTPFFSWADHDSIIQCARRLHNTLDRRAVPYVMSTIDKVSFSEWLSLAISDEG